MTKRSQREARKKRMHDDCKSLGITVPERANIRQLEAALDAYHEDAVVVHAGDSVEFRQTDKPTAEYTVHFTIYVAHSVRAESQEAACKWVKENAHDYYRPDVGNAECTGDYMFIDVDKHED